MPFLPPNQQRQSTEGSITAALFLHSVVNVLLQHNYKHTHAAPLANFV